jgi:serine protease
VKNNKLTHRQSLSKKIFLSSAICLALAQPVFAGQSESASFSAASIQAVNTQTDRIIVKFKSSSNMGLTSKMSVSQMNTLNQRAGASLKHVRRLANGAQLLKVNNSSSIDQVNNVVSALNNDVNVEYAEVDKKMYPMMVPNDSRYNEQWQYYESTGGINLPTAWDTAQGSGVVVAVIDTGYRPHNDLAANILPGYDMISDTTVSQDGDGRDSDASDEGDWSPAGACYTDSPATNSSWHGTHVSGTIAAVTNNSNGVAGVAYNAKVLPVRVLGRCGGYTSDIADGMIWAAGGSVSGVPANPYPAQVLNLSLGGSGSCSITTQNAINTARSLGATVVVAAGNSNTDASSSNPANCNGVITVAATSRAGGRAYYSNYGSVVDIAAPGGDFSTGSADGILSTLNSGTTSPSADSYAFYQGTSMATPHIAGVAALLYEVDPTITPDEVESTLTSTARSFPATCNQCGAGIVDASAAVDAAGGVTPPPPPPTGNVLENGVAVTNLSASIGQSIEYTLEVPAGMTSLSFAMSGGTGDADLYVKFGSAPTTSSYDCRPYLNGNSETCNFSTVQAGTYYVMVQAYSSFSGVSLVANFDAQGGGGGGFTETNLSASRSQWLNYTLDVPAGMSALSVNMSGGTGDADLYVRYAAQPTTSSYDCRPYKTGNTESCNFSNPSAGVWYISIRAYSSFSGVTLDAQYTP